MKVKEESEKAGLKLNIQKTKIMASGPITSWQIDGETVETVTDFILRGELQNHCRWWLQLLGGKVVTNLDSILKSRDITFLTNVYLVKVMVFPVVMYGCDSWTIKKAEHRRIDAFERWCWKRFLRVPWTARRSNQSILKEISPEYSLEGLMLKLKLHYFGHLMWRANSEKTLMLGKIEGRRRRGWQSSGRWWRTGKPGMLWSMESQRATEQQLHQRFCFTLHFMLQRWLLSSTSGTTFASFKLFFCSFLTSLRRHRIEESKWKWNLLSGVRLFVTPLTIQSMEFSRPEYWSG